MIAKMMEKISKILPPHSLNVQFVAHFQNVVSDLNKTRNQLDDNYQTVEEPDEFNNSRPVLKTSGVGDGLAEFNCTAPSPLSVCQLSQGISYSTPIGKRMQNSVPWPSSA
jgi:hypothetical protein